MKKLFSIFFSLFYFFFIQFSVHAFDDFENDHPYAKAVHYLKEKGHIEGYDNGTARPDIRINRAELTAIMIRSKYDKDEPNRCIQAYRNRVSSEPTSEHPGKLFSDVDLGDWFAKYVCVAKRDGLIAGYKDETFRPANFIVFSEAAKIIVNAAIELTKNGTSDWFEPFVKKLEIKRAIPDSIDTFGKQVTRGEISEIYYRILSETTHKSSRTYDQMSHHFPLYKKAKNDVNIRKKPDTEADLFYDSYIKAKWDAEGVSSGFTELDTHRLKTNQFAQAIGDVNGKWQKIKYYDGREAWIHNSYLEDDEASDHTIRMMKQAIDYRNRYYPVRSPRISCANIYDWKLKDADGRDAILIYHTQHRMLFFVEADFFPAYAASGGACGRIGVPLEPARDTQNGNGEKGRYQKFENGFIYQKNKDSYYVYGGFLKFHQNLDNEQSLSDNDRDAHGTYTPLGFPISNAYPIDRNGKKGYIQSFEGGKMFWTGNLSDQAEFIGDGCEFDQYSVEFIDAPEYVDSGQNSFSLKIKNTGIGHLKTTGRCAFGVDGNFGSLKIDEQIDLPPSEILKLTIPLGGAKECEQRELFLKVANVGEIGKINWVVGNESSCGFSEVENLIRGYRPCGVAESNANRPDLVVVSKFDNNCSLEMDWSKTSPFTYRYAGVLQGDLYWDRLKEYIKYKMKNKYSDDTIDLALKKEKDRRSSEYIDSKKEGGLNIVDIINIYNLTNGGNSSLYPEYVVLHRTGSNNLNGTLVHWSKAANDGNSSTGISANYFVDENGTIYQVFNDNVASHHVGDRYYKSSFTNGNSIGIEVTGAYIGKINSGDDTILHAWDDLSSRQKWAVSGLILELVRKYSAIKSEHVCSHEYISQKTENEGAWYEDIALIAVKKYFDSDFKLCSKP